MSKKISIVLMIISIFVITNGVIIRNALADLNDGLVAYYPFNGNANDESGNNNNGIVHSATLTEDKFGTSNSAYKFDGIDDYIEIGDHPSLDGMSELTISVWIKPYFPSTAEYYQNIIGKGYHEYILRYDGLDENGGTILGYLWHDMALITLNNVPASEWRHIVFTWYGGTTITRKIYADGMLAKSAGPRPKPDEGGNVYIGCDYKINREFFNGIIDEIRIYNRALNEVEIKKLYSIYSPSAIDDTISPTITATFPNNNQIDISVDAAITVTFSEDMDSTTITSDTFLVNDGFNQINGTMVYCDNIATLSPLSSLDYDTTYTVTITNVVTDFVGNPIENNYSWSFTTTKPLWVIDTDNDGVIDEWDQCPNTSTGAAVYSNGCEVNDLYTQEEVDQLINQAVADAEAAKDIIIAQKDQEITTLNDTITSMYTQEQLDQAVADAEAAKDQIIAQRDQTIIDLNTYINKGNEGLMEIKALLETPPGQRESVSFYNGALGELLNEIIEILTSPPGEAISGNSPHGKKNGTSK